MKGTTTMLALIKAPGAPVQRIELPHAARPQIDAMRDAIGANGFPETAVRGRDFVVWCHDAGKMLGLPLNFHRPTDGDFIVGTVLITGPLVQGLDGYEPSALDESAVERIDRLLNMWAQAGELCGTRAEHFDPRTDAELREAERAAYVRCCEEGITSP